MKTICGIDCSGCGWKGSCKGRIETDGHPFGGECVAAECYKSGGEKCFVAGYGSKMMDVVLYDIAKAGYSKVMLLVFEDNVRARRFYEKLGFTASGKVKTKIGAVEVCYEKTL